MAAKKTKQKRIVSEELPIKREYQQTCLETKGKPLKRSRVKYDHNDTHIAFQSLTGLIKRGETHTFKQTHEVFFPSKCIKNGAGDIGHLPCPPLPSSVEWWQDRPQTSPCPSYRSRWVNRGVQLWGGGYGQFSLF